MKKQTTASSKARSTEVATLPNSALARWVSSHQASASPLLEPDLRKVFEGILWAANQYVPSECGSICLAGFPDAPDELVYIGSFGASAHEIPGTRLGKQQGITGRTFRSGKPHLRNDVKSDRHFFNGVDERTRVETQSLLAVPIFYEEEPCGVLTLINRCDPGGFNRQDQRLMEVFTGYLSTSLRNLVQSALHREMAQNDHLSGLRNDRYFYAQLQQEMEGCERYGGDLSLVFLDLDGFKAVVDTYGHPVGSQVLAEVGRLLARVVRHPGATLARYGGDEYVLVLPGAGSERALQVAEEVRHAIGAETYLQQASPDGRPALQLRGHFTASVGVASLRELRLLGGDLPARRLEFIRAADEAMYEAKRAGKDRVCLAGAAPPAWSAT